MLYERLEIIRRAANGEIYRRITCLAGRVTVLRSREEGEIEMYAAVLRCDAEHDRFSMLLDGRPFLREQQVRVSCDEDPLASERGTLWDYLLQCGLPGDQIVARLDEVGLGGLERAPVAELTPQQRRVLLIVAVTAVADRVVILHDPFLGVPTPYAEVLSRRLAENTWRHSTIVVVSKLTARPEAWVENEHITRVQLERPRDRTIGFGGGELSSSEFIQAFREQLRQADSVNIQPEKRQLIADTAEVRVVPPAAPDPSASPVPKRVRSGVLTRVADVQQELAELISGRVLALAGGGVIAALALVLLLAKGGGTVPHPNPVLPTPQTPPPATSIKAPPRLAPPVQPVVAPPRPQLPAREMSLLDAYPPAIHQAVMKAFYEPQSVLRELPSVSYNQPAKPKVEVSAPPRDATPPEMPRELPPPPTSDGSASSFTGGSPRSPEELQAQRELLRRAFVDAVMRARERQMQMQYGGDTGYPQ